MHTQIHKHKYTKTNTYTHTKADAMLKEHKQKYSTFAKEQQAKLEAKDR